jgi:hypothetical protein
MANLIAVLEDSLIEASQAVQNPNVQAALQVLNALPVGLSREDLGGRLASLGTAVNAITLPTLDQLLEDALNGAGLDPSLADDIAAVLRTSANLVDAAEQLAQLAGSDVADDTVDALNGYVASVGELSDALDVLDDFEDAKATIAQRINEIALVVSGP